MRSTSSISSLIVSLRSSRSPGRGPVPERAERVEGRSWAYLPGGRHDAEGQLGATDRERGAGGERGFAHFLSVHLRAVGGAEIAQHGALAIPEHLGMATAGAGIRDGDVRIAAAADHRAGAGQLMRAAVDLDDALPGDAALD